MEAEIQGRQGLPHLDESMTRGRDVQRGERRKTVETLLIRADANTEIGTGHLMRCLALAQAWQAQGMRTTFLSHCPSPALRRRVRTEGARFVSLKDAHPNPADLHTTLRLIETLKPDWLAIDGYHFDPEYQKAARAAGVRMLAIDDMAHWPKYHADIVLNQNLGAEKLHYHCDRDTRLLLGTRYVLLRTEFLKRRGRERETPREARKVLVTMGGSDPDNVTLKVIRALERVPVEGLEVTIVLGASNPHRAALQVAVRSARLQSRGHRIHLVRNTLNMPELMAWADTAVAAGGSTSWELAHAGVPSLVLVLADNQTMVADALDRAGVARKTVVSRLSADISALLADEGRRRAMRELGLRTVDGAGAERVVVGLRAAELTLRRARLDDSRLVWEWRNDSQARAASFSSEVIPLHTHEQWFRNHVSSPTDFFYVALNSGDQPIGQVRFTVRGDEAVVSVGIAREARGRGYGAPLILRGSRQCFADSRVESIQAYVKPGNTRSLRAFQKAGYAEAGTTVQKGQRALRLMARREDFV